MFYKIQKIFITIVHFILLYWIYYILTESGHMPLMEVCYHFVGISLYGSAIIAGSASWAKYHYVKDLRVKRNKR